MRAIFTVFRVAVLAPLVYMAAMPLVNAVRARIGSRSRAALAS